MTLVGIIFVAVLRSFMSVARTRALLGGRREGIGNVMAAGLGVVTPFCSCSAVPAFIGFVATAPPSARDQFCSHTPTLPAGSAAGAGVPPPADGRARRGRRGVGTDIGRAPKAPTRAASRSLGAGRP